MRFFIIFMAGCFVMIQAVVEPSFAQETEAERQIDEAVERVDNSDLDSMHESIRKINDMLAKIEKIIEAQYKKMLNDVISGSYREKTYLSAIEGPLQDVFALYESNSFVSTANKMQRILERAEFNEDKDLAGRTQSIMSEYNLVFSKVAKYKQYRDKAKGTVSLDKNIFLPLSDQDAGRIIGNTRILDQIVGVEENKLEYFLIGDAEKMYPEIMEGKTPFCLSSPKKVIRETLIKIRDGKTYDAEKELREAAERYSDKDPIVLLYSYVLLINWHDKRSLQKGHDYLNKAYERLETELLAHNLARVELRLGILQEGRLMKLIAHTLHRRDLKTVGDLNNILLYTYIKNEDFSKAQNYLKELRRDSHENTRYISPVFKYIIYLKQGEYELIADDVVPYDQNKEIDTLLNKT